MMGVVLFICWHGPDERRLALILLGETVVVMAVQLYAIHNGPYDSPAAIWCAIYMVAGLLSLPLKTRYNAAFCALFGMAALLSIADGAADLPHGVITGSLALIGYAQITVVLFARRATLRKLSREY